MAELKLLLYTALSISLYCSITGESHKCFLPTAGCTTFCFIW